LSLNFNAHNQPPRTFVRRQGRITPAQLRALQTHSEFLVDHEEIRELQPQELFGRKAPLWVEIGFGNGATLAALAADRPDHDFLGIEVHKPGVGHLLLAMQKQQLRNIRVASADAVAFVERRIADASVSRILILFPDPWPKQRQRKRRLLQPAFAHTLARKLAPGSTLARPTTVSRRVSNCVDCASAIRCAICCSSAFDAYSLTSRVVPGVSRGVFARQRK
jgi:tRNA (guanine-N7-)-methyltransferase